MNEMEKKEFSLAARKNEIMIDFRALLMDYLDKVTIVILVSLLVSMIAYLLVNTCVPMKYRSTTKIYILPETETESISYNDLEAGSQLTMDYIEFVKGRTVVEDTIEHFKLDCTYDKFCSRWLSVSNPPDTRILTISISCKDPFLARDIAMFLRNAAVELIESSMSIEQITVWEEANLPDEYAIKTEVFVVLIGMLVFIMLSGIIVVRYLLVDKIVAADDVESRLSMPVLGSIVYEKRNRQRAERGAGSLARMLSMSPRVEEAMKTLRANVEFCGADCRVIALTSSVPNEGKSTISIQLANQLALSGKRVLYVDSDMRKSVLAERLAIPAGKRGGLSELLVGKGTAEELILQTEVEGLHMILAGNTPPNPSELLGSNAFESFLAQMREEYDYIIIDTPPLASVIDGAVIGRVCDGVIVVIGSDMVSSHVVTRVSQQLERADCKMLGAVVNKIKLSNRTIYGTYGSNQYYYRSYGRYHAEK